MLFCLEIMLIVLFSLFATFKMTVALGLQDWPRIVITLHNRILLILIFQGYCGNSTTQYNILFE